MKNQKQTRSFYNSLFLVILFLSVNISAQSDSLNFLVLTDWGGKANKIQLSVGEQMGLYAEKVNAKFVVSCGDNYHSDGIESAESPRWKTEFEEVYKNSSLMIPWYPVAGNHDNLGSVDGEIAYSKLSERWKFPSRYYSQIQKVNDSTEILFVHIDTTPLLSSYWKDQERYNLTDNEKPAIQYRWIDSVLASSDAEWKFVVGHHPIFSGARGRKDPTDLIDNLLPLLEKYNVQIYFCGHDHIFQHVVKNGRDFFTCGSGSTFREPDVREGVKTQIGSPGFISATVKEKNVKLKYIDDKGETLYSIEIPSSQKM